MLSNVDPTHLDEELHPDSQDSPVPGRLELDESAASLGERINDRFTLLADHISEGIGQWWFTALSVLPNLLSRIDQLLQREEKEIEVFRRLFNKMKQASGYSTFVIILVIKLQEN